jgi:phosphate transport system permease protein
VKFFFLFILIGLLSAVGFIMGRAASRKAAAGRVRVLHSLPSYYGGYVALWCALPALLILALWTAFETPIVTHLVVADLPEDVRALQADRLNLVVNDIQNLASGNIVSGTPDEAMVAAAERYNHLKSTSYAALLAVALAFCAAGAGLSLRFIKPALRARIWVEKTIVVIMIACSTIAIFTTIGIVLSVLFESLRFFQKIPFTDFLFGLKWSPQIAIRADQVGSSGAFGIVPVLVGTFMISAIAMLVAVPIGLFAAIYMSEYAADRVRATVKPVLEILAGIPTVVYGFFAALVVAPYVRSMGERAGFEISSESALAAGLVMGIMIIPFVSSLSDDVINAVPQSLRDGSYGLGATQSETIIRVLLPAALPGFVGSVLLAVSRAIGETMIVVMAAGLTANLTANPFQTVTTVTVQIVTLLIGDQEFDSAKTLAAFALGLVLFILTLCLNIVALYVVRRYREQYE